MRPLLKNCLAALALGIATPLVAQAQIVFAVNDPAYPKQVEARERGLDWAVQALPVLAIKEGASCKEDENARLAFADGQAKTYKNVYSCQLRSWAQMPVKFSKGADSNPAIKDADLKQVESWILQRMPSLMNVGAAGAQPGAACDAKLNGVTGRSASLQYVLANILRCDGGVWKQYPDLAAMRP